MAEFNFDASIPDLIQELKAIDCPVSLEHALVHMECAMEDYPYDLDQIAHDLGIAYSILKVLNS
ncbi:hypothetical protein LCGC14_0610390 [marine sediment metagenome]|uniref:Uncharacterized protein n=1 Tax=marine sediment metagenome TaxID=412755 RepID=A0A0F9R7X0_9ZZZZ